MPVTKEFNLCPTFLLIIKSPWQQNNASTGTVVSWRVFDMAISGCSKFEKKSLICWWDGWPFPRLTISRDQYVYTITFVTTIPEVSDIIWQSDASIDDHYNRTVVYTHMTVVDLKCFVKFIGFRIHIYVFLYDLVTWLFSIIWCFYIFRSYLDENN